MAKKDTTTTDTASATEVYKVATQLGISEDDVRAYANKINLGKLFGSNRLYPCNELREAISDAVAGCACNDEKYAEVQRVINNGLVHLACRRAFLLDRVTEKRTATTLADTIVEDQISTQPEE